MGAQQIGAQRGAMMDEKGAGKEYSNRTPVHLWPFAKADAVASGQRTKEQDVGDDGVGDRPTSVISRRRVQRGALSVITTQRKISTRQHPVENETHPELTCKTLPMAIAAVVKPSSRTTATRGE